MIIKTYANGQKAAEQRGRSLTYYYRNGLVRARGPSVNGQMVGAWIFKRETGQLWSIGHFKNNLKHGLWVRYDRQGNEEYRETFVDGKVARPRPTTMRPTTKRPTTKRPTTKRPTKKLPTSQPSRKRTTDKLPVIKRKPAKRTPAKRTPAKR